MDIKTGGLFWDEAPDCIDYDKNTAVLEKRVSELVLKNGKTVIAFDFDELVLESNLTKIVAGALSKTSVKPDKFKKLKKTAGNPANGIEYMAGLAKGLGWENYRKISSEKAKETVWRQGFKELVQELNSRYNVIFINEGPKEVVYSKLKEINFEKSNIIGDEFIVEDGIITGFEFIVLSRVKGRAVASLRAKNYNVISIGHSIEDLFMLHNSSLSIAYCRDNNPPARQRLANYYASSAEEIRDIIKKAKFPK